MKTKRYLLIEVSADANVSDAVVQKLTDDLINIGLSDAVSTLEDKDVCQDNARLVLDMDFTAPRIVSGPASRL